MSRLLYLGGPSAELDRVEVVASLAESNGWEIAEPWWKRIRALCRSQGGFSSGLAYELGLVRWKRSREAPSIIVAGNPRGHVGIWTPPRPIVVGTDAEAIAP